MRQDHHIELPGGGFHYIDWGGNGPLLHLGHATGFCAGAYTPLAEMLSDRFRVIGLDDRGHGLSTAPADPGRLKDWWGFAADAGNFFASQGRPVIAAGHSRAGVVALLAATRWPKLVSALILIDPTILPRLWMWWWYLAKKIGAAPLLPIAHKSARRRNGWADRAEMLASYQGKGPFPAWRDGFLEAYVNEASRERAQGGVELCCDPVWESRCFAVCPHDVWRHIPKISCPTLVLYGKDSDTFLPAAAKYFAKVSPEAKIVGLEKTSHFVPQERPAETKMAIVQFLEEHGLLA